jgi:hypothetical protein
MRHPSALIALSYLLALGLPCHAAEPQWQKALCKIWSGKESSASMVGCEKINNAPPAGAFALRGPEILRRYGVTDLSVTPISPGKAEVRGLTERANNSRWGEARHRVGLWDCWVGEDFGICVRPQVQPNTPR